MNVIIREISRELINRHAQSSIVSFHEMASWTHFILRIGCPLRAQCRDTMQRLAAPENLGLDRKNMRR